VSEMSTGVDIISLILAITVETVSRMSTEVDVLVLALIAELIL
jgi:hypothetical protein